MMFPRNKDGRIDIDNGEYSKDLKTKLNVKYEKECRLGLGCAMVTPRAEDGTPLPSVGRRCHPFNYTSKVLIGFDDFEKMKKTEISRVKSLSSNKLGFWLESGKEPGKFYRDNNFKVLKSCGKKAKEKLHTLGINTFGDLMDISDIENHPVPEKMIFKAFKNHWDQVKEN